MFKIKLAEYFTHAWLFVAGFFAYCLSIGNYIAIAALLGAFAFIAFIVGKVCYSIKKALKPKNH